MRIIKWDKAQIEDQFGACNLLKDVIFEVETQYQLSGEYVCHVLVNGMRFGEDDEEKFALTKREEISQLEVSLGTLNELVIGVLKSYTIWIPNIKQILLATAKYFHEGDLENGQRNFIMILDSCRYYINSLIELKRSSKEISESVFVEEHFSGLIREVMKAYEKKDYVLLADLVEYELHNLFDTWLVWAKENLEKLGADKEIANIESTNSRDPSADSSVDQSR